MQYLIAALSHVWKLKCMLYNNVSFFYVLEIENHEIQDLITLCEMEIKLTLFITLGMTWNVSVYASTIALKPFSSAIFMRIIVNFCAVARTVRESEYKTLLQAFRYNVALHAATIMFGYCRRWHCGAWWASVASTTMRRKVVVYHRMTANEKIITTTVGNLQLPIISSSSNSLWCFLYHHQPWLPQSLLASTRGSSQNSSQFWFFYSMLQHL